MKKKVDKRRNTLDTEEDLGTLKRGGKKRSKLKPQKMKYKNYRDLLDEDEIALPNYREEE